MLQEWHQRCKVRPVFDLLDLHGCRTVYSPGMFPMGDFQRYFDGIAAAF